MTAFLKTPSRARAAAGAPILVAAQFADAYFGTFWSGLFAAVTVAGMLLLLLPIDGVISNVVSTATGRRIALTASSREVIDVDGLSSGTRQTAMIFLALGVALILLRLT